MRAPRLQTHGVRPVFGGCGAWGYTICYVYVILEFAVGNVAEVTLGKFKLALHSGFV